MKAIILLILILNFEAYGQSYVWAKNMGGSSQDFGNSIAIDQNGNVYTTGVFNGTVDFDPSGSVSNLTSNGERDVFVSKLDANGNFIWAKSIGGGNLDNGMSITTDDHGNVYITGDFMGTVDFDPSGSVLNLIANGRDVFVLKLDANGNFLWAKKTGTGFSHFSACISIDNNGNVYTTGAYHYTSDFDPSGSVSNLTSNGGFDIFVSKLDSNGNYVWAKSIGGWSSDEGVSISTDQNGNVYTTGIFTGTVDFDPSASVSNLTTNGSLEIFILKLDANGNFVWAKSMGGSSFDYGRSISTDQNGNIYTTGSFAGISDFDPGASMVNLTSNGSHDIFISKLDADGNYVWAKSIGGSDFEKGSSISLDNNGNVYITGWFEGIVDFDPSASVSSLTATGRDVYILKLDASGNFIWVKKIGGNSNASGKSISINNNGNIYTTGLFEGNADFDPSGAVSNLTSNGDIDVFISKLSPACANAVFDYQTVCDSLVWIDGITYFTDNTTATHTLTNISGCDSIISLNLDITNISVTDIQTACDSLIWIDGLTYYTDNTTATHILTSVSGCDSTISLNLDITNIDMGVTISGTILTAVSQVGGTYQWLNCSNGFSEIPGEIASTFTATINDNYSIEITYDNCIDTSDCVTIADVGLDITNPFNNVKIYPNPINGLLNIQLGSFKNVNLKVYNINQQLVFQKNNLNTNFYQIDFDQPAGIYIIEITVKGDCKKFKFISE